MEIAVRAAYDQPVLRQLSGAAWPDEEGDVAAGLEKPAAEISADAAGTDDESSQTASSL